METRCLFQKPGNLASALAREISRLAELGWRNFFCKRAAVLRLPGCVRAVALAMMLASSSPAHGHGGNGGGQNHQQPSQWYNYEHHDYYRDPFWGSWYPGYSGVYDSNYSYTATPEQQAAAEKRVQEYLAAVKKGRKHPATHRYIAVQTLRPTKKQVQDYLNKRAAAKTAAANGETQLSNRWVEPDQLRCIMVFDAQSKQFVGSGCYIVSSNPPDGKTAKFDTFTAEFVGNSQL
jgi:hypothetical protein